MKTLKNHAASLLLFLAVVVAAIIGAVTAIPRADAQPAPSQFTTQYLLAGAKTATGAASSSRNVNLNKTYQVTGSTGTGTGTAVVTIQGSNDSTNWDIIGTVTLTLSTTQSSGSFSSTDRYLLIRPNASTLTGTTATWTATMAF